MCDFGEPGECRVQLRQCAHGTIHLTIGHTTLHMSPEELVTLYETLGRHVKVDQPPRPRPRDRFGRFDFPHN